MLREDLHGDVNGHRPESPVFLFDCAQEKIDDVLPEIIALLPDQHAHTGDLSLPLDPNWNMYRALENTGRGVLLVVRQHGEMLGYAGMLLHPHLNAQKVIVGTIPTYYAKPGPSRGMIIRRLLLSSRDWLLLRGAQQVFVETVYDEALGLMMANLGFLPNKIGYKLSA